MIDAVRLLGSLLQQNAAPSAQDRLQHAVQRGAGGPLDQLAAQFGGSEGLSRMLGGLFGQGGNGRGFGEMLGSATELARRAAQSPVEETRRNNPAAMGGLGALAGALLGGGRGAVGGGLLAVLGSLAYAAMQGQGRGATAPESLDDPAAVQRKAMLLLRAMIQAAKSDGQIDAREMERISGKLTEAGEDNEARAFVLRELRSPLDLEGLAREATSPQEGAEIYAASLMAIELDTQAERDYLARLATALHLPEEAVARIHGALGVNT
jgi:uncharacterized membrane protein YebE (DUF533 family)